MPQNESRIVIVTGATRGLGRAMTARLAEAGHRVIGCGRSKRGVADLRRDFPSPHRFDVVDVAADAAVAGWAADVIAAIGPPDLLVNNAAVVNTNVPLWEVSADEFSRVIDVNIKGVANCIRHFAPAMIERGTGVIVNFSSTWGRSTSPEVAPYCATKFAVEGLTQSLAQELPRGMAAVPFNPGIIDTDMLRICFADGASAYPDADTWSRKAVPFLLSLGPAHNGQSVTAPM